MLLTLVNPLPRALAHYADALRDNLGDPAIEVRDQDIERGSGRIGQVADAARLRLGRELAGHRAVVLWPTFGALEPLTWRLSRAAAVDVVVHDPVPIREQRFTGPRWEGLARRSGVGRVHFLTHTEAAATALRGQLPGGARVDAIPHPIKPAAARAATAHEGKRLLVLGQHKPTRDLDLLSELAAIRPDGWDLRVAGRGWPAIPGWDVREGFLAEAELDAELDAATVLLVPYRRYWQSGVAVRALERALPVVGRRHEFLEGLLGTGWPGLVDDTSDDEAARMWQAAVALAAAPAAEIEAVRDAASEHARKAWQRWAGMRALQARS